jgi:hypothetical protein
MAVRGLEHPVNNRWEDITGIPINNDKEWREQLLCLEWEVLGRLWDSEAINRFMETRPFRSRRYHDYGELKDRLIDYYPTAPIFLPEEQRRILLGVAYQDHVVLDPQTHVHYLDIARKIADFRARKVAAEQQPARRRQHEITRAKRHGNVNALVPGLQRDKRQREKDLDEEVEDEAKPKIKKARQDMTSGPIKKTSPTVQAEATTKSTPEQSAFSGLTKKIDLLAARMDKKRRREIGDEENPNPEHKKARRVTAPTRKVSKTAQADVGVRATATPPTSSTESKERCFVPKLKDTKRQRDQGVEGAKPERHAVHRTLQLVVKLATPVRPASSRRSLIRDT